MKYGGDVLAEAVQCFEIGFADKAAGRLLGILRSTVGKRLYAYRTLGTEALFVTTHRKYDYETKVRAPRAVVGGGMAKPDAMEAFGLKSMMRINDWCGLYREGGPDALLAKPKGRSKKSESTFSPAGRGWRCRCASWGLKSNQRPSRRGRAETADSLRREYPLGLALDKLGLLRSTCYRYTGGKSPGADRWANVRPLAREAFPRTSNGMGYRQIAMVLRAEWGLFVSERTALKLMRKEGLRCRIRRKRYDSYRGRAGQDRRERPEPRLCH